MAVRKKGEETKQKGGQQGLMGRVTQIKVGLELNKIDGLRGALRWGI